MKFTVFIALFFALAMSAAVAESHGDGGDGHERHGKRHHSERGTRDPGAHLTEALGLSEDQAAEISAIFEAQRAEHEAMRDSMRAAREEERAAHQSERCARQAEMEGQILAILDDDQAAKFADMKAERAERMAERQERMAERMERHGEDGGDHHKRGHRRRPPMEDCG